MNSALLFNTAVTQRIDPEREDRQEVTLETTPTIRATLTTETTLTVVVTPTEGTISTISKSSSYELRHLQCRLEEEMPFGL